MDPNLQDRLAYHLLLRRGYAGFMAGTINRTEFGKRLAMEWASFTVLAETKGVHRTLKRGQSYHPGPVRNQTAIWFCHDWGKPGAFEVNNVANRLVDACEKLLCEAGSIDGVTARAIASLAGTPASAVSYYFGSQEKLIIAAATRVYRSLNVERMALLEAAIKRAAPNPPALDEMIAALVGPSVRWSLDPTSKYRVLVHFTAMAQGSGHPELYRNMLEGIEHHRVFMPYFRMAAPWLSEAEIGWRMSCALGIRSQVTRSRLRNEVLTNHTIDFSDPDTVIANIVAVVVPMFRRPG